MEIRERENFIKNKAMIDREEREVVEGGAGVENSRPTV
jgi:hypothetical protein